MPQLSLTDFVDIIAKAGRPKATKVRQIKERPDYEPAFDFYKPIREHLIEHHRNDGDKAGTAAVLDSITDPKKLKNYPELLSGYKKWWGRKKIGWFNPPRATYSRSGFDISINPELGLVINDERHIIKLYLKSEPLTGFKTELIVNLLEHKLRPRVAPTDTFSILDVRRSKLFQRGADDADGLPIINAEIAYIASIWRQ